MLVAVGHGPPQPDAARRRRASWAPTSSSATRSGSACRSATAGRTRRSSRRARSTCARRRVASSACRWTRTATPRTGWRCRRASSTSGARRRRRTSAPRRRCWPTSPGCTPSTTARRAHGDCRARPRATPRLLERELAALGVTQLNEHVLRHAALRGCPGPQAQSAGQVGALTRGINFRYRRRRHGHVALDETVDADDVDALVARVRRARAASRRRRAAIAPGRRRPRRRATRRRSRAPRRS